MSNARLPGPERREQLLRVARTVLARRGYHATSMNDIADEAGVTKPVLYQHFASKRDLFRAVLDDVGDRLTAEVLETAAQATSGREQLEAGVAAYVQFVQEDYDGFFLLFSGATREDDEWRDIALGIERSIADSVAQLIAVPGMGEEHRLALAHGVVGMAEGMVRYWQTASDSHLNGDDLTRDLTTLAWVGLRGLEAP